ncbi:AMP-binding protein [Variovorax robiniae]|uniref:Long-chain-fatty-acid--CoA ligase n=1 Tax=Variovorax robiniae TaxID=1836199 RepID=A0ABU8X978_9BURK
MTSSKPWLASYGSRIPAEIDPNRYASVVHLFEDAMRRYADKPAFHSFGHTLSYADCECHSRAFAAYLQKRLDVRRGDRIGVMMPNLLAFPIAMMGILRAGAAQVNINPLYTPRELEHQLNDAGVEVLVIFSGSTPTLGDIIGNTGVKTVITVDVGDGGTGNLPSPPVDTRLAGAMPFSKALALGAMLEFDRVELAGDDLLFLQYTGGTTGVSKGAALSHRNVVANTEQFKPFMPDAMRPGEEVVVTALPLYHIFALMVNLITYFSLGAQNWLVANPRDMDGFVAILAKARCSVITGVNTLFGGMLAHPRIGEVDFSNLRLAAGGGSAILASTSAKWKKLTGLDIQEGYGLSETSPVVSFNPQMVDGFSGTVGLPLPSTEVKLVADKDHEVAIGEAGEVCVRGPQVMRGYWQQPEANASAFTDDGFFRTGDVGVLDDRGFLRIVDRKKDMVLVSGFNVYPNEIEAVVAGCPGVLESACVGVSDERTGEAVKLFVVPAPGATLTEEQLAEHCRRELVAYKVPRHFRFVDALPKSTVGKILRRELRDTA